MNTEANARIISPRLSARGIRLIVIPSMHAWANGQLQSDGIHVTEEGYAAVAAHLLPQVMAAIRRG